MSHYAIGVDLGGTSIKAGLVERARGVVHQIQLKTGAIRGPEHVVDQIAKAIREVLKVSRTGGGQVIEPVGVGVGAPGAISLDRRCVSKPPNFPGWDHVDLAQVLGQPLGLPVVVENDANLAGLGSAFYGAGRSFDSFLMVTLGTGVGGAIIHEKRLFRGTTGGAGEFGHVSIDYEGPYARSGVAGAIEAYLGLHFLSHHAKHRLLTRQSVLHEMTGQDLSGLTPRVLHQAADSGDEAAIEMLAWAGHKLGCALGSVVNLLDIRKVVVGGGVSAAGDFLLEPARDALRRSVMPAFAEGVEIVQETLGNEVALLGAGRLAFEHAELSQAPSPEAA